MYDGEILNETKEGYPLYKATLYGDKLNCAKFSKRLSCAIKHLPLRLLFSFEYDTLKAIEVGVIKSPTLFLDDILFLEGLVQAETITQAFEKLLSKE
jgi:hypothetical protein